MRFAAIFVDDIVAFEERLRVDLRNLPNRTALLTVDQRNFYKDIGSVVRRLKGLVVESQRNIFSCVFHCGDLAARIDANTLLEYLSPHSLFVKLPEESRGRYSHTKECVINFLEKIRLETFAILFRCIVSNRRKCPYVLPRRNFTSNQLIPLMNELLREDIANLSDALLRKNSSIFSQSHPPACPQGGFVDDRGLRFCPSANEASHGLARGDEEASCYLNGTLRFGVTISAGFHYDVTRSSGLISGEFWDSSGKVISVQGKKYMNVFPNDHIITH